MYKNYLKIALRNIGKYKFFSAINILGMTIGITASLMIILWVADELSYDRFHKDYDRIYQVGLHGKISGQDIRVSNTCTPLAPTLEAEVPEVESATRLVPFFGSPAIKYEDKVFAEERVFFVDSNFFQFFSFRLLEGDPKTALKEPNSIVFTSELATKYFGETSALGKMVTINGNETPYKVTGVAEKAPSNSHFHYNVLVSSESNERVRNGIWLNNFMFTYFKLHPHTSVEAVESKFPGMVDKYIGPEMERFMGVTMKQMEEQGGEYGYFATKIADLHLHSTTNDNVEDLGNVTHVYFFSGIGIFILLIACINFMNLSTARSAGRAKEVGLRKTLGSQRKQMVFQFLSESLLYSFVSVALAIVACYALLPSFNLLAGKQLGMEVLVNPFFVGAIIALIILVGVIAGSYPAFYLTAFNPVEVLKGKVRAGMKSKGVRSFLVVLQFFISISLIIFTIVVYEQIQYMHEQNIGLDKQNIIVLPSAWRLRDNKEPFRNALDQLTGVEKISYTNNSFPGVNNTTIFRSAASEQDHIMGIYYADYDHMDVLKFSLGEGRYFSEDFPSDSTAILLNEAAVKEFGMENPIGEEIIFNNDNRFERLKVIGVIKNFNFESFKTQVRPLSIRLTKNSSNLMIRYSGDPKKLVSSIEELWKKHAANEPFEYAFLDERFDNLFRGEQRMGKIFGLFAGLAIFIACLGLFALAAFTSEQRTKEIGVRKALGATSLNLTLILSKEFIKLVIIAFIPAAIIAWYAANEWLAGFSQRVDISPWIFIISGLSAVMIAWLTVSFQAIKAAATNPVTSLRYE
jgi:putative ABC transport system permease protein